MLCLLVDDDENAIIWCSECLESLGLEVLSACNGIEALKIWEEKKPPLIVLDWVMPEMDGIEFLKELKIKTAKDGDTFPRVIMSSAHNEQVHFKEAMDAGAKTYLSKPYSVRDLEATIGLLVKIEIDKNKKQ